MKKNGSITSVESKAAFREKLVEKFVQQNLPPKVLKQSRLTGMGGFTRNYKEFECCAVEAPADGTIEILFTGKLFFNAIRRRVVPIDSRFFIFFTREDMDDYKVAWSCSLS